MPPHTGRACGSRSSLRLAAQAGRRVACLAAEAALAGWLRSGGPLGGGWPVRAAWAIRTPYAQQPAHAGVEVEF